MKNILFLCPALLLLGCGYSTTIERLKDSLTTARHSLDSLKATDAFQFSKALQLENRNRDSAMAIYHRILNPESKDYFGRESFIRFHYLESLRFLDAIKRPEELGEMSDSFFRRFRVLTVDSFLTFIHSGGLTIKAADMWLNGDPSGKYTIPELRRQLTAGKGPAFETISQVSLIYSEPYPQYNTITMNADGLETIRISFDEFELTFTFDGSYDRPIKLTKIECFHIADL